MSLRLVRNPSEKKDSRQAGMTEITTLYVVTYGLVSNNKEYQH